MRSLRLRATAPATSAYPGYSTRCSYSGMTLFVFEGDYTCYCRLCKPSLPDTLFVSEGDYTCYFVFEGDYTCCFLGACWLSPRGERAGNCPKQPASAPRFPPGGPSGELRRARIWYMWYMLGELSGEPPCAGMPAKAEVRTRGVADDFLAA